MIRKAFLVAVAVVALSVGCGDGGERVEGTYGFSASEIARIRDTVEATVLGHSDAWNAQDVDAIVGYWDDDTVHSDTLFGVLLSGEDLFGMPEGFLIDESGYRHTITEVYIADGVAVAGDVGWGVSLRGVTFTEDDPMVEFDRIEVGDDGSIGEWRLLYGLDQWAEWGAPGLRLRPALEFIEGYGAAWASADPAAIAGLYAADAIRVDSLRDVEVTGPDAIADDGAALFAEHPGTSFALRTAFTDSRVSFSNPEQMGSTAEIDVPGGDGTVCTVRLALVWWVSGGLIVSEEVFWDVDSLIACDWAR